MPKIRASWLVLIAVIIIVAAVPALRERSHDHVLLLRKPRFTISRPVVLGEFGSGFQSRPTRPAAIPGLDNEALVAFVESSYPRDSQMLMAAGSMLAGAVHSRYRTPSPEELAVTDLAVTLLRRAIDAGAGGPAWIAYFTALLGNADYERLGTTGTDPARAEAMEEIRSWLEDGSVQQALPPALGESLLKALKGWREDDPENAMPVAFSAWVLYGLHRDAEALNQWKEAARMPVAHAYQEQLRLAATDLLRRLGYPEIFALDIGHKAASLSSFSVLRAGARVAYHEGRLAQLAGRGQEAVELWMSTADLGHTLQQSADDLITVLVGRRALEAIGAGPAWRRVSTHDVGTKGFHWWPAAPSRFYYGNEHAFFVDNAGRAADAALRDRLVANEA